MENKKCPNCGAEMRLREKDGSKFWACPNYKTKFCKTQKYEDITGTVTEKTQNGWAIIADEIAKINKRLDKASDLFLELRNDVDKLMGK